jgi:hypothetical protein
MIKKGKFLFFIKQMRRYSENLVAIGVETLIH